MKDGENCCKRAEFPVPDGYELISDSVLKMWSDRLLENWNLYKQELNRKPGGKPAPGPQAPVSGGVSQQELARQIQEVVDNYESSTSWRVTKPLRALARWFRR